MAESQADFVSTVFRNGRKLIDEVVETEHAELVAPHGQPSRTLRVGVSHLRTAALANHAREITRVESNFVVSAIVVCGQFRKRGGDVHADAALVEFIARAFVVDQKFVDGVVIAVEGVVVVVAIVGIDDDTRIARHHARFVIVVRRAVGIERDAVEIDFVVNVVLKSSPPA